MGAVQAWHRGDLKVTIKPTSPEAPVSVCPGLRPVSEHLVSTKCTHQSLHPWPAEGTVPSGFAGCMFPPLPWPLSVKGDNISTAQEPGPRSLPGCGPLGSEPTG